MLSVVKSFLEDNEFTSEANQIKPRSGITTVMCDESRHWLDPIPKLRAESCTEVLLDHLHRRMSEVRETVIN